MRAALVVLLMMLSGPVCAADMEPVGTAAAERKAAKEAEQAERAEAERKAAEAAQQARAAAEAEKAAQAEAERKAAEAADAAKRAEAAVTPPPQPAQPAPSPEAIAACGIPAGIDDPAIAGAIAEKAKSDVDANSGSPAHLTQIAPQAVDQLARTYSLDALKVKRAYFVGLCTRLEETASAQIALRPLLYNLAGVLGVVYPAVAVAAAPNEAPGVSSATPSAPPASPMPDAGSGSAPAQAPAADDAARKAEEVRALKEAADREAALAAQRRADEEKAARDVAERKAAEEQAAREAAERAAREAAERKAAEEKAAQEAAERAAAERAAQEAAERRAAEDAAAREAAEGAAREATERKVAREAEERAAAERAAQEAAERRAAEETAAREAAERAAAERAAQEAAERRAAEETAAREAAERAAREAAERKAAEENAAREAAERKTAEERAARQAAENQPPSGRSAANEPPAAAPAPSAATPQPGLAPSAAPPVATPAGNGMLGEAECRALGVLGKCPDLNAVLGKLLEKPLEYNHPKQMLMGRTTEIGLVLRTDWEGKDLPKEISDELKALSGEVRQGLSKITRVMSAELSGPGFEVSPSGRQERTVSPPQQASWNWQVEPVATGRAQPLKLRLYAHLQGAEGTMPPLLVKTLDANINVDVTAWDWVVAQMKTFEPIYAVGAALIGLLTALMTFLLSRRHKEMYPESGAGSAPQSGSNGEATTAPAGPVIGDLSQSSADGRVAGIAPVAAEEEKKDEPKRSGDGGIEPKKD